MAKGKYETKVVTADTPDKVKVTEDICPVCKSTNVIVRVVDDLKTVTCLEGGCQYVGKYRKGRIF